MALLPPVASGGREIGLGADLCAEINSLDPGQLAGNADCTWVLCFANPDGMDFSPFPGTLLTSPGALPMRGPMPREDFFGVRRRVPPKLGAIERPLTVSLLTHIFALKHEVRHGIIIGEARGGSISSIPALTTCRASSGKTSRLFLEDRGKRLTGR